MSRSPNYRMKDSYIYFVGAMDSRTIEAGTYVRPVDVGYVPKHVLEDKRWVHFDPVKHVFVYWRHGFVPIPKTYLGDE